ncbi:unnamed protein product [Durusdinium trenchii]|uniref:DNA (cytosine-5-)-methyltransferase n=2 Tax=Durusdinium trenchii TaxID=1381693 RepID=A0ABP0ID72_9DINO
MPLADLYRGSCQPSDLGPDRGSLRNLYQQFGECESRSSERSRSRGNSSDGTQEPDDTNLWPFVNWAPVFFNACGMPAEQYAHALSQPLVVGTACTGSAAPSFALDQIVGAHNFSEVIASESHATTRKWLLENRNMHHLYHDLAFARTGGQCQVHHQHCPPMPLPSDKEGEGQARLDIYISGFVCKNFSQENNVRFQHSDVRELFISANIETARKAKPFLETSRFIRKYAPKVAILENVFGLAKRSSKTSSTDEFQAPIDFVLRGSVREAGTDHDEPIGLQLIPGYAMDMFRLKSKDFGAGQTRSRIYFIMVHHSVGDQNTLDHIGALLQTFAASMPATSVWDAVDYVKCCKHDWTPEEEDLDQSDVVGGKTRESFDKAKADLGMDTSSYEEYRAFTLLCKQRDSTWPRGLNGREIEQLDIIYHLLPIAERSRVVTDVVKSLGRRAWRSDGLSPTQGFDVSQIHFSGYKRSFFSLLSGNAMTMPVIGGCLLAVLLTTALRSEFRSCVTEEPQSGLAQSDDDDQDDATDASGSSSNFPQHLRDEWPTLAHSGSGYSSSELEWLYNAPPGRVL